MKLNVINSTIEKIMDLIEKEVFKNYLRFFSDYEPKPFDLKRMTYEDWKQGRIRSIKISKIIRNKDELDLDNLCQLFQAFNEEECTLSLLYHHINNYTEIYFTITDIRKTVKTPGEINILLDRAIRIFSSTFAGADISRVSDDENEMDEKKEFFIKKRHIITVSNLASEKIDDFVSLENLFNYQDESEYYVLFIAEPVISKTYFDCEIKTLTGYMSQISEYENEQFTKNQSLSTNVNLHAGTAFVGGSVDVGVANGEAKTKIKSDYSIKYVLDRISKSIERSEMCKAVGGWKFAAYILSDEIDVAKNVAYQYNAIVKGKESNSIPSAINLWEKNDSDKVFEYLSVFQHPVFVNKMNGDEKDVTVLLSSLELAHAMNLPRKSISGFPVTECATFGRNVINLDNKDNSLLTEDESLYLGDIWHLRHDDKGKINIDIKSLTSHVFITGSTGSGKSNTTYQLLDRLIEKGIKFLVIEPAKGEYKTIFGGRKDVDVSVYGTNYKNSKVLKINPFSFPEGVHIYSHLDRLVEIFNTCWPMYAAMPAILKDAIEKAYVEAGWDLQTSENTKYGRLFPTFKDVLGKIDDVMNESDYSGESKGDYKGALKTRLKSLTNGIFGLIFGCSEITDRELFEENVIVDLSEIGSETTSLIMGLLVLKLHEYKLSLKGTNRTIKEGLKHVTVLEEAHNILKNTSTEQHADGSNVVGKSVEMITNAIAEMRSFGEGFIIVDQAPGLLDIAAIRNTNTKIILRLPDYNDREVVGRAIGLNENQIFELGKLERGLAAVYQSGWAEAVLCKFDMFTNDIIMERCEDSKIFDTSAVVVLNAILYGNKIKEMNRVLIKMKDALIYKSALPLPVKHIIWRLCSSEGEIDDDVLSLLAYEFLDADSLYSSKKTDIKVQDSDIANLYKKTLKSYQINDMAISRENLDRIISLISFEHDRRDKNVFYEAQIGGIR